MISKRRYPKTHDKLVKPRLLMLATTLCAALLWSAVLSGCGVRKPPLPVEDLEKPRYPPR